MKSSLEQNNKQLKLLVLQNIKAGKYQEALRINNTILNKEKSEYSYCEHGYCYTMLGNYEKSLEYYDQAITCNEKYKKAHYNKAYSLIALNRFDEAIICLDKAIQLDPEFKEAYANKGNILKTQGKIEEAKLCFSVADKLLTIDERMQSLKINDYKNNRLAGNQKPSVTNSVERRK